MILSDALSLHLPAGGSFQLALDAHTRLFESICRGCQPGYFSRVGSFSSLLVVFFVLSLSLPRSFLRLILLCRTILCLILGVIDDSHLWICRGGHGCICLCLGRCSGDALGCKKTVYIFTFRYHTRSTISFFSSSLL